MLIRPKMLDRYKLKNMERTKIYIKMEKGYFGDIAIKRQNFQQYKNLFQKVYKYFISYKDANKIYEITLSIFLLKLSAYRKVFDGTGTKCMSFLIKVDKLFKKVVEYNKNTIDKEFDTNSINSKISRS